MNYLELKNLVSEIDEGKKFEFNLSNISDSISKELDDFFKIADNSIHLFNSRINKINEKIISFYGEIRLKSSNVYFETNIVILNKDSLEYIITIEPNGKWVNKVSSKINNVVKHLPVSFGETIFIHSSLDLSEVSLRFDENKIYEVAVSKGNSLATHIESELLKILNIPDTLFFIQKTKDGIYKIFKNIKFNIDLAGILNLNVYKINIIDENSISVDSILKIPFLNGDDLSLDTSVSITEKNYHTRVKLLDNVRLPIQEIFKGLTFSNLELDFQGSFVNPTSNIYGIGGNFTIGDQANVNSNHDFSYQTLKSNEFNVKFNPINSSYVPIFFQAYLDELSMSKGITLISGKETNLPSFIDPIKLYSTYIYYCAPNEQNILINGTIAKKGVAISSGINILGLDAYCEYSAIEDRTKGNIILEPINLANLIKIEGDANGTPSSYKGPKIKKGGVQLFFDSQGPIYFRTDVTVNIFDLFKFKTGANVQESGLQFYYDIDLGIVKTQCNCILNSIDDFQFTTSFEVTLIGLNADLGSLGKLNLDLDIFANIHFSIKMQSSDGLASLQFGFNFNGSNQKLNLSINVKDLKNIEDLIKKEAINLIKSIILSPLEWLKSIINEIIKVADDIIEEAKIIAKELEEKFNKTIEEAAKLLKNAGYETEKAARILLNGFTDSIEQVASILNSVNYPIEKITQAISKLTNKTIEEVFNIMRNIGAPLEEIGKGLKSLTTNLSNEFIKGLQLSEKEAASLLKGLGKSVEEQARILKDVLEVGRSAADTALRAVGNLGNEVTNAINKIFGGGSGSCTRHCVVPKPFGGCAVSVCV